MANEPSNPSAKDALQPFTVEFIDDYGSRFQLATPPFQGIDIIGGWDKTRMANRPEPGRTDLGERGGRIPSPIPGMMLTIDIRRRKARLFSPLMETESGKKVLEKYNAAAKITPGLNVAIAPEPVEFELDADQLKTLLLELLRKMDSKCLEVRQGAMPTLKQVNELDGDEFYDPSNSGTGDCRPTYKKDLKEFKDRQRAVGVI